MDKKHCQLEELHKIAADDYSAHALHPVWKAKDSYMLLKI